MSENSLMNRGIHHVGFVVKNLENAVEKFEREYSINRADTAIGRKIHFPHVNSRPFTHERCSYERFSCAGQTSRRSYGTQDKQKNFRAEG